MANCKITGDIDLTCDDLRRLGGLNNRFWVYGPSDVTVDALSMEGYVEGLTFAAGTNSFTFGSPDNSCSAGWEAVSAEGGNKFFNHTVAIKLISTTPTDDEIIEEMLVAKMTVIVETQNQEFLIYGINNGLKTTEGAQNSGAEDASDTTDSLTLAGGDKLKPKRFLLTDYATTLALLVSYETPAV
jgi:hypothetical protein